MRARLLMPAVMTALVIAACGSGGGDAAPTTTATATSAGVGETSTTAAPAGSTTVPETPTTADPERPAAPDFELSLGTGGVYALAAETKPVYLVFWAEW